MTVRELIERLQQFDPGLEVLCYCQDDELRVKGHSFRLLDIESVDVAEGQKVRGDDGVPSVRFGKTPCSQQFVSIDVTCDF